MAELNFFRHKRVELIEGQVVVMSPMNSPHATAVALAAKVLDQAFGTGYFVRWQMPFAASAFSEPEPDVAVVVGGIRDYSAEHPKQAALLVEAADSSLAYDQEMKSSLYAKAGVEDYWIINLVDRQIEVYRAPTADDSAPFGFSYRDVVLYGPSDNVEPLALPGTPIAVADLLP